MAVYGKHIAAIAKIIENDNGSLMNTEFESGSIDSRTLSDRAVFFAIRGERRDGHDFVIDASMRAGIVVVDEQWWEEKGFEQRKEVHCRIAVVKDTVGALGELARLHRRRFSIPVIAITGSSGKTTTKDMIVQVLGKKYSVHYTKGNFNNHLGLPLTLFALDESHEVSVVEMGMNHPGELEILASIAEPTHGIITNIGKGHLGFFDSVKDIAREKGMLFQWIGKDPERVAFVNADDELVVSRAKSLNNVVRFGLDCDDVEVTALIDRSDDEGCYRFQFTEKTNPERYAVQMTIAGKHNVSNALAAATVGLHFNVEAVSICDALETFTPPAKRSMVRKIHGITIVDDTYNANPDSMRAAMETFRLMKAAGKKILVLGDMLELGDKSGEEHGRTGLTASETGFEYVFTFGTESEALSSAAAAPFGGHYDDKKKLVNDLMRYLENGTAILVKGSRGMKMEEIIELVEERLQKK